MRILFITEEIPYPLDTGGNVRTFNLIKSLAKRHKIVLIATSRRAVDESTKIALTSVCHKLQIVRLKTPRIVSDVVAFIKSFFTGCSMILSRHRYQPVIKAIRAEFAVQTGGSEDASLCRIDAVYFNHLDAAVYDSEIPRDLYRTLDEHNVVASQVSSLLAAEKNTVRRMLLRRELHALRKVEPYLCNQMNFCSTCSSIDAEMLRSLGVTVALNEIPNGVDLSIFTWNRNITERTHEIIFFGTMDYPPCEQGMWHFLTRIFPFIRTADSELSINIVGRNPSVRLADFASSCPSVKLAGRVPDVRLYVQRAKVCIVPLLSGSGTRLKILEAFALGTPVVSTSIGAEGLEVVNGRHLLIADDPRQFAENVLKLVRDTEQSFLLSKHARNLVEEKYDWNKIGNDLLGHYENFSVG